MKKPKLRFRTLIISDVHLGATGSKVKEVNYLLKFTRCDRLILNGDIIDTWALKRNGVWTKDCTVFIRHILKKIEKHNTQVIYTRGNHDDLLERFLPMSFAGIQLMENYKLRTLQGDYLVLHGDVLDAVNNNMKFLSKIGAVGYGILLRINRLYNLYRKWRGKEYYSFSAAIKARVKKAVNKVSSFEPGLAALARGHECQGIICGHIHKVEDKRLEGGIHYLNSGDWVESMSALVEEKEGHIRVMSFAEFRQRVDEKAKEKLEKKSTTSAASVNTSQTATMPFVPHAEDISNLPAGQPPEGSAGETALMQ